MLLNKITVNTYVADDSNQWLVTIQLQIPLSKVYIWRGQTSDFSPFSICNVPLTTFYVPVPVVRLYPVCLGVRVPLVLLHLGGLLGALGVNIGQEHRVDQRGLAEPGGANHHQ